MGRRKKIELDSPQMPPATTIEARENQMISLAVDLAERQLRDGTASSQVIAHYLKLGTTTAKLEKRKLEEETKLLTAKAKQVESIPKQEEMFREAIMAMSSYRARMIEEDDEEDL